MSKDSIPGTDSVLKDVFEAGSAADPDVLVQTAGKELVNRLFMMIRNGKVHDLNNQAVMASMEAVRVVLTSLIEVAPGNAIMAIGDAFYLNKTLLKADFSSFENFRFLAEFLGKFEISGFRFDGVPPLEDLRKFLNALLKSSPDKEDAAWVGNIRTGSIKVIPLGNLTESEKRTISAQTLADPNYLLRLYLKTVLFVQDFIRSVEQGELGSISRLQRCVHEFVDAMGDESRHILTLAAIRSTDDYLAYHSVNVTLLSLLVGKKLGLSKHKLSDLGASALLHDIGKVQISNEILTKKMPLNSEDWAQLNKSNTYSLMQLIRLKGFNESALRRMLVAYEHTLAFSQEGSSRRPTLLSRIVSVAHCYDAMTTAQSYRDALLPKEAIKIMAQDEGTKFDPAVFRVFVTLLTSYPPGTVVKLNSGEVGIVTDAGEARTSPHLAKLVLLYDSNGNKAASAPVLDLAQDPSTRSIVKTLDASKYSINPLAFLLAGLPENKT